MKMHQRHNEDPLKFFSLLLAVSLRAATETASALDFQGFPGGRVLNFVESGHCLPHIGMGVMAELLA